MPEALRLAEVQDLFDSPFWHPRPRLGLQSHGLLPRRGGVGNYKDLVGMGGEGVGEIWVIGQAARVCIVKTRSMTQGCLWSQQLESCVDHSVTLEKHSLHVARSSNRLRSRLGRVIPEARALRGYASRRHPVSDHPSAFAVGPIS